MAFANAVYTAVTDSASTFKNPRQKMWGVFVRPSDVPNFVNWQLCLITNDIREARSKVDEWLKIPPVSGNGLPTGINNVILGEIIPIDSDTITP